MAEKKWPPIKLERRYANPQGRGEFIIVAVPLTAALVAGATDEELMARHDAERAAIAEEWRRIRASR